jgi:hypothetical protein
MKKGGMVLLNLQTSFQKETRQKSSPTEGEKQSADYIQNYSRACL